MVKKVIATKGLPGSGKSCWAKQQLHENGIHAMKRVNKDDIRAMLHDSIHTKTSEKFILQVRDSLINEALNSGCSVIVDDTNLNPIHEKRLKELAKSKGAQFEIKDFTNVPIEVCIERDLKRFNSVGEKVIRKMYDQWLKPKPPVIEYDPGLPDCILCDLDGSLALLNSRNPYDASTCDKDEINLNVLEILNSQPTDRNIIFVSGRSDKYIEPTLKFLSRCGFKSPMLFMRKEGDTRKDFIIKKEIYLNYILNKYNTKFVIDDRPSVIRMWRYDLGLYVFQLNDQEF